MRTRGPGHGEAAAGPASACLPFLACMAFVALVTRGKGRRVLKVDFVRQLITKDTAGGGDR